MNDLLNVVSLRGILEALREDIDDDLSWDALADWGEENGLDWDVVKHPTCAVYAACLEIASKEGKHRLEWIQWHEKYAEPGYSDPAPPACILTGDWNSVTHWDREAKKIVTLDTTPELLSAILEKLGCELEWEDEWCACSECGGLVRTQPDCFHWEPHYVMGDGELLCLECHGEENPPDDEESADEE